MAELIEVITKCSIALTVPELGLLIHALNLGKKQCGLEGKKPVTVDNLKEDLIEAYEKMTGENWRE